MTYQMQFCLALIFTLSTLHAAEDTVKAILVNRVETAKKTVGMVIGTIDANGSKVQGLGKLAANSPNIPDGDTLFEIGSISKVFTSLLLADMIEHGEVKPDDPVQTYLPAAVKMPSRNGRQITLLDLSMQVSGLPGIPDNMKPADPANPYSDYTEQQLYEFLSRYKLTRDPGEKYEYSNLAVGLLGQALARKAGMSYEQLVRTRVLDPLGMKNTFITVPDSAKDRFATGHNKTLQPVKYWDLPVFAGAGALRSSANDMLRFLSAHLEITDTPLKPAMRRMRSLHKPTGTQYLEIMMGWHLLTAFDSNLVWHNGGTAGFRTFAGIDPANKKGAVVLCNTSFDADDVGRHLVIEKYPLKMLPAPAPKKAIAVDPKLLESYAGIYDIVPGFALAITTAEGRLYCEPTSQPKQLLLAEKKTEFVFELVDARVHFTKDGSGKVSLNIIQNGQTHAGKRRVP